MFSAFQNFGRMGAVGAGAAKLAPLDVVSGVTITGAWGFARPLLTSWGSGNTGRVRNTVTATQSDFATPAQADAFLGADAGAIVTLYDQSGAGHNLTQPTTTSQPAYNNNVNALGRAGSVFDAANDSLAGANMSSFVTAASGYLIAVCSFAAFTATQQTIFAQPGGYATLSGDGAGKIRALIYDGVSNKSVTAVGTVIAGDFFVAEMWWDGAFVYCRVNGNATASVAAGSMAAAGLSRALTIGAYAANYGLGGPFMEGAAMSAIPSQATQIIDNMKSFYGI